MRTSWCMNQVQIEIDQVKIVQVVKHKVQENKTYLARDIPPLKFCHDSDNGVGGLTVGTQRRKC